MQGVSERGVTDFTLLCRLVCGFRPNSTALVFICVGRRVSPHALRIMFCSHLPVDVEVDVQVWSGSRVAGVRRVSAAAVSDQDALYDEERI